MIATEKILDGKAHAAALNEESRRLTDELRSRGVVPGLSVVLVGEDPASEVYVRNKAKAAQEAGLAAETIRLPAATPFAELARTVRELVERDDVDGILVQLPLPRPEETTRLLDLVDPAKDVDGFHPENLGRLVAGRPRFVSCTPAGIMAMLEREKIELSGRHAVVVGRSNIVGKPMAALLVNASATVTVCHSRTKNLAEVCRSADVLVAAAGRAGMIGPDHVREGAVVVDVGINPLRTEDEVRHFFPGNEARLRTLEKRGQTLIGDVDYTRVAPKAARITPVPGGVGPLTIAMLVRNTVTAAELRRGGGGE